VSRGCIAGNAIIGPGSGSDAYTMRTTAEKRGDRYVLNGSKTFVTNGSVADALVVFATVDKKHRPGGISAFLVEKGTPGMQVARSLDKMGMRRSPMAEIFFEGCEVPEERHLARKALASVCSCTR
jgi:alkylation response protein AidB-like acyl-CoA dehydrogenase